MHVFKRLFAPRSVTETAEVQSDELGRIGRLIEDAQWALDSALSAQRKDAAGYRLRNAANRDGGESFDADELDAAVREARAILASAQPLVDLLDRRARTEAAREVVLAVVPAHG